MVRLFNTLYFLHYEGNLEFLIRRRIFFNRFSSDILEKEKNKKINLFMPKIC